MAEIKTLGAKMAGALFDGMPKGKVFSVTFVKRTNGELRDMSCRTGTKAGVTGKGQSYDPKKKNLRTVTDVVKYNELRRAGKSADDAAKGSFRMINLETVTDVRAGGEVLEVTG